MNTDTPTPRTDAAWNDPTTSMGTLARQLEWELAAVTKERDEANEACRKGSLDWLLMRDDLLKEIAQLRAENERLRADGARLVKSAENHLELDSAETHRSLRAAIDATAGFKPSNDGVKQP